MKNIILELAETSLGYSNFSKEEWQVMRALANDRSIVIKKADKTLYHRILHEAGLKVLEKALIIVLIKKFQQ